MKIGILALQGSFSEHAKVLQSMQKDFVFVRSKQDLESLTHIIIPGGESTTLEKLLKNSGMWNILESNINNKKLKVLGTCAGAILLQKLGMDMECERNGYGAQLNSFSAIIKSDVFENMRGIFIRAPRFVHLGKLVCVIATYQGEPVVIQQENLLALTFHPEISSDSRIHTYFLEM
jgi:5'-phosphate synthase pdxT subunit